MEAYVDLNSAKSFSLKQALLIYNSDGSFRNSAEPSHFVTSHKIRSGPSGEPTLGPGTPIALDDVYEMLEKLRGHAPVEFLPENVLVRTQETTVWWVPATTRPMFYAHEDSPELADLSGKRFPQPALVFKVSGDSLEIRALTKSARPKPNTPLFRVPYWNVYESGDVCLGSTDTPKETSLASLELWEKAFYQSEFTHPNVRAKLTLHEDGFMGLWSSLIDKKKFPVETLVDAKQTLAEFISGK